MFDYEIAFSLLSDDEPIARAVQDLLPPDVSSFLYSVAQREIQTSGDGLEVFPDVFRRARICVILHRDGWGKTRWTRLEEETIADRFLDEGAGFLVLVRLDASSEIPPWFPRTGLWINYRDEGRERTAEYILSRLTSLPAQERFTRAATRTYDRRPVPIARYSAQRRRITEQYTPVRPEICDDCTAAVEFRPLLRVKLLGDDHWPASEEQFCPPCALKRGLSVTIPHGMTREVVYAVRNPTFREHIANILRDPVLPSLSEDAELRAAGVSNVGAAVTRDSITLLVYGAWNGNLEATLAVHDLEKADIRSPVELRDYAKAAIIATLENR